MNVLNSTLICGSLICFFVNGCGIDSDGDGIPDFSDQCPHDSNKTSPGQCGCGVTEGSCSGSQDTDADGVLDQDDKCPHDPQKSDPGICGCGFSDHDSDGDNTLDCKDNCQNDPNKIVPGDCGCGKPEGTCGTGDDFIEAENYTAMSGCNVLTEHTGYSGAGYVDYGSNGSWIEWTIDIASSNNYTFTFHYANGSSSNRRTIILVNGNNKGSVAFAPTGSFATWSKDTIVAPLITGINTIRLIADNNSGGPNLDWVDLIEGGVIDIIEEEPNTDPSEGDLWIVTFPGKGDATLFVFPDGKTMMVDSHKEDNCKMNIIPFLKRHGIRHLDYIIITHGHGDHSGGVKPLRDTGFITNATVYEDCKKLNIGQEFSRSGTKWHISNADDPRNESGANENSVSYRMEYNGFVMSGAGDEKSTSQKRFLKSHPELVPAHVRYMAHHCVGNNPLEYLKALNSYVYICPITEGHQHLSSKHLETLDAIKKFKDTGGRFEKLIFQDYYFVIRAKSGARDDWTYFRCDDVDDCPVDFPQR